MTFGAGKSRPPKFLRYSSGTILYFIRSVARMHGGILILKSPLNTVKNPRKTLE